MYLEQLVNHPEMARDPSRVARRNNSNAYARLMGGRNGKIGLFESDTRTSRFCLVAGFPQQLCLS